MFHACEKVYIKHHVRSYNWNYLAKLIKMDLEIFGIRKKRRADGLLIILQKLIILTKREITRVHERNKTVRIKKIIKRIECRRQGSYIFRPLKNIINF